jgi:hypothetical protein
LVTSVYETALAELIDVPEAQRSYSGWYDSAEYSHAQSTLAGGGAWSAPAKAVAGDWMQMDLGKVMAVNGVVTMARGPWSHCCTEQRVTKAEVRTSIDGTSWTSQGTFAGNVAADGSRAYMFFPGGEVNARHVRIVVLDFTGGHPSMRAAVTATQRK